MGMGCFAAGLECACCGNFTISFERGWRAFHQPTAGVEVLCPACCERTGEDEMLESEGGHE